ncbi:hypothetical protein HanLR1_Chr01g0000241 [Helianthus annuus]|nr:hypothetical protein HanHA89_Chr01g0000281 [Helianthus annuus]KAJ0781736.1 hypothetical protein HanLR1_Chr01g0000241 [Helianthus annuus]
MDPKAYHIKHLASKHKGKMLSPKTPSHVCPFSIIVPPRFHLLYSPLKQSNTRPIVFASSILPLSFYLFLTFTRTLNHLQNFNHFFHVGTV